MEQEIDRSAKTWAMACHLSALAWILAPAPVFINILGPLIVWLVKKNDSPFIDDQGKESVNFQLSISFYALLAMLVLLIVGFALPMLKITAGHVDGVERLFLSYAIIIPLALILLVFDLVEVIIASIKASNGQAHRYPLRIKFIK